MRLIISLFALAAGLLFNQSNQLHALVSTVKCVLS